MGLFEEIEHFIETILRPRNPNAIKNSNLGKYNLEKNKYNININK